MLLYNVTVKIDLAIHDEWLDWMREKHIPDVMHTGLFQSHRICRLLDQDESDGITYAIQYFCENLDKYWLYQEKHAHALQQEHAQKFRNHFVAFRTLLKIVE
jgi:hypothetical protein